MEDMKRIFLQYNIRIQKKIAEAISLIGSM